MTLALRTFESGSDSIDFVRIAGGMGAIISALAPGLPEAGIRLGGRVTRVVLRGPEVEIGYIDASGAEESVISAHGLLALPPRLLEPTISFSPALDADTAGSWRETPTWMAPHAKFFTLYDRPFWREAGLSGTAQHWRCPVTQQF